jgi:hypothetical protein
MLWKSQLEEHVKKHGYFSASSSGRTVEEELAADTSSDGRSDIATECSASHAEVAEVAREQRSARDCTEADTDGKLRCTVIEGHHSFDMAELRQKRLQTGVLHCSCWDAVDESLAVQQRVGMQVLEQQLQEAGLLSTHAGIHNEYPEVSR